MRCSAFTEAARVDKKGVAHRRAYRVLIPRRFMGEFGFDVPVVRRDLKQVEHNEGGEAYTLCPVRSVRFDEYDGEVLNLTSSGHDSYLTDVGTSKNCGIGKSFAALVPAVHHATQGAKKKRVLYVTAGIALQEQIVTKDLPALARVMPTPFTFALVKGRSNYACLSKAREAGAGSLPLFRRGAPDELDDVLSWIDVTRTGDKNDFPGALSDEAWSRVATGYEDCPGKPCPDHDACFFTKAKEAAEKADVVVTNYHVLCAHIAVLAATGGEVSVLPAFDLCICDEAHELADIAREMWGWKLTSLSWRTYAAQLRKAGLHLEAHAVESAAGHFVAALTRRKGDPRTAPYLKDPADDPGDLVGACTRARDAAQAALEAAKSGEARGKLLRLARRAAYALLKVEEATTLSDPGKVVSLEEDGEGRVALRAQIVDVAPVLTAGLFRATPSVVAMSATMATSGNFSFVRSELGVPAHAEECAVESPFDFRRQALFVCPAGTPDPRSQAYETAAARAFWQAVRLAGGRTLGLFTSYRAVEAVRRAQPPGLPFRVLYQGEAPRTRLVDAFRTDTASVLIGTTSLWTGVDVPGEALSLVVIDKLPFPSPGEPVAARRNDIDPASFKTYFLPRAIMRLRQGFGRLVRAESDRGAVVVLDPRLVTKGYGREVVASLPPAQRSTDLAAVGRFLATASRAHSSRPNARPEAR
jgi:ATP-dependent DNA helicase DinG